MSTSNTAKTFNGNIFCIGRNYAEHVRELGNTVEADPIVFMKPTSSLINGNTIILPSFSSEIHYETELVVMISKECRNVSEEQAKNCFDKIAIGLDLTARDLQSKLKTKGLPWLLSKGFDNSCYISEFTDKSRVKDIDAIPISMELNGERKQHDTTRSMIFTIPFLISFLSQYFTLKPGDVLFTGTPSGVGKLEKGDKVKISIDGIISQELLVT